MSSAIRLASLVAAVAILWSNRVDAVTPVTNAVGVYDETAAQQNNVDFNATGNAHPASTGNGASYSTVGSFNSLAAGAFVLGRGGVVNFDSISAGTSGTTLGVDYGSGKSFTMTFSGLGYTISTGQTVDESTAISDSNYLESTLVNTSFTITFGPINGAPANETGISEIGLSLLSATLGTNQNANFGTVTVTAHFSDTSTASASRVISEAKEQGDTFFSILAPSGLTITSVDITAPSSAISSIPDIDDIAFITNAPGCAPAPAGMVSWWKAEGDTNDSQDSNNGTFKGTPAYSSGEVGQAFSFDGNIANYISVPAASNLDLTTFTVDAWINPTATGSAAYIVDKSGGNSPGVNYYLALTSDNHAEFGFQDGSYRNVDSTNVILLNTWTHLAGTYDGATVKLYVNGALDASLTYSGTPPVGHPLRIGLRNDDQFPVVGLVDEVEIFSRALTDTEVATIFAAGSNGKCGCTPAPNGMVSWWPGDLNTDDIQDGNNGSWNGTPAYGSGEVRQAFSFDGDTANYILIPHNNNLDLLAFTVDAWVYPTADPQSPGFGTVVDKEFSTGGINYFLTVGHDGTVEIDFNNGNHEFVDSAPGAAPQNTWTHIAGSYDGPNGSKTVKLYVNGVLVVTHTVSDGFDTPSIGQDLYIGVRNAASLQGPFQGLIDEV